MPKRLIDYGYEPLGQGSSRLVFAVDDDAILKVATSQAGIIQNRTEFGHTDEELYTKNYALSSCGRFLLAERVVPLEIENPNKWNAQQLMDMFHEADVEEHEIYFNNVGTRPDGTLVLCDHGVAVESPLPPVDFDLYQDEINYSNEDLAMFCLSFLSLTAVKAVIERSHHD